MPNRYDRRQIFLNKNELYDNVFEERNINSIRHYASADFEYPSVQEMKDLTRIRHVWKVGDRYYKLASQYYNSPQYWWVIALFNKKPTEADLNVGDLIYIPLPLQDVLRLFNQ